MPLDRVWTGEELDVFRDEVPYRTEIVDGVLMVGPRSDLWHSEASHQVRNALVAAAPGGAWAYCGSEIRWSNGEIVRHSLISDVIVGPKLLRDERAPYADGSQASLVVEVVSPHSEVVDRLIRPALSAELGIPAMWLIERDCTLVEYRLTPERGAEILQTVEGGTFVTDVPFPVTIDLEGLR